MTLTIGVDIGGTKVAGGVVDADGEVLRPDPAGHAGRRRGQDPRRDRRGGRRSWPPAHQVEAVGIGAAGWIDATRSTVLFAPNLAWRDEPLRDYVHAAVGLPVVRGERRATWPPGPSSASARPATPTTRWCMFTVGTGIGGGIVLGGELVRGAHGIAAELGPHARRCRTATRAAAAGSAASSSTPAATPWSASPGPAPRQEPDRAALLLELAGGDPEAITGPMVTAAAQAATRSRPTRSPRSATGWASALADLVQILDPQVLVVGGGVIEAGELLMGPTARARTVEQLAQRGRLPVAEVRAGRDWATPPAWSAPPTWPGGAERGWTGAGVPAAGAVVQRAQPEGRPARARPRSSGTPRPTWWSCRRRRAGSAGGTRCAALADAVRHGGRRRRAAVAGQPDADQPAGPGARHLVPALPAHARAGTCAAPRSPRARCAAPGSWWPARTWPPTRPSGPAQAAALAGGAGRGGAAR